MNITLALSWVLKQCFFRERYFELGFEAVLLQRALFARGGSRDIASLKQMQRGKIDCGKADVVCGCLPFAEAAMRQQGITIPRIETYPLALTSFFHRLLSRSSLGVVARRVMEYGDPVFIKPAERTKRFTGFVLAHDSMWNVSGISAREPVWVSEVVCWLSEWRLYIVHNRLLQSVHYHGDAMVAPDQSVVSQMLAAMASNADVPHGYAIDVGVLTNGQTALVEVNDGYGLGAYEGLDADIYLDLLYARWKQLKGAS